MFVLNLSTKFYLETHSNLYLLKLHIIPVILTAIIAKVSSRLSNLFILCFQNLKFRITEIATVWLSVASYTQRMRILTSCIVRSP